MSDPTEETIIGLERLSQYPTHQDCPVENHDITLVATDALSLIAKLQARITEPEAAAGRKLCTDWQCPEAVVSHYNDRPNCVNYRPREVLPPRTQEQTGFPTEAEWDGINKTLASGKREEDAKDERESKPTSACIHCGRKWTHDFQPCCTALAAGLSPDGFPLHEEGQCTDCCTNIGLPGDHSDKTPHRVLNRRRAILGHNAEGTASRAVQRNPQIPVVDDQRRVMTASEEAEAHNHKRRVYDLAKHLWLTGLGWTPNPAVVDALWQKSEAFELTKAVLSDEGATFYGIQSKRAAERNSNSDTK